MSHYHGAGPARAPGNETREKLEDAAERPQLSYKRDLIDRIASLSPSSLLDVGCGKGDLLRAVADGGCATCVGIEVDSNDVARLRAEGLKVHHGRAERLPFENGSFDIVVMDYVAHHLKNLEMGLLEAARVSRMGVLILDGWYDLSIASQEVAQDFDLWLKKLDRAAGGIHNPCPSALKLARIFRRQGDFDIDYRYRLLLRPMPISALRDLSNAQLAAVNGSAANEAEYAAILERAEQVGVSEDGSLLFSALHR